MLTLPPVVVAVRSQLHHADCGLAALAMACGLPYETAYQAAPTAGRDGLTSRQLQALATRLGFSLRTRRAYDLESDTGIVGVEFRDRVPGHWLYLRAGALIDPSDGTIWDPLDYLHVRNAEIDEFFSVTPRARVQRRSQQGRHQARR